MFFGSYFFSTVLFLIVFFIVFSIAELLLIYGLNHLVRRYWKFFIDTVIRAHVHHPLWIQFLAYFSIAVFVIVIFFNTSLLKILYSATPALKGLTLGLPLIMILVYFIMARRSIKLTIEKRLYNYFYIFFSFFLYTVIVLVGNRAYGPYQHFIDSQLIAPAVIEIENTLDHVKKEQLLHQFRSQFKAGECPFTDFSLHERTGLVHFVHVATDADLAQQYDENSDSAFRFSGYVCHDDENTFLLKPDGNWYWVFFE
ncbi:hypothetical protein COY07_06435 [Candidatus Peregrinibacteria bacterium CG_4_10_14_0_2_um_filter_43_11]|nr:MAG: hypothetical protein COY07_06435 [Candidatus Peregrinibacteria bacterium CG_4_10_14_0_2_um_filter_43_11]